MWPPITKPALRSPILPKLPYVITRHILVERWMKHWNDETFPHGVMLGIHITRTQDNLLKYGLDSQYSWYYWQKALKVSAQGGMSVKLILHLSPSSTWERMHTYHFDSREFVKYIFFQRYISKPELRVYSMRIHNLTFLNCTTRHVSQYWKKCLRKVIEPLLLELQNRGFPKNLSLYIFWGFIKVYIYLFIRTLVWVLK